MHACGPYDQSSPVLDCGVSMGQREGDNDNCDRELNKPNR